MKRIVLSALALVAISSSAVAAPHTVGGSSALALASIVAQSSPSVTFAHKTLLAKYLNGWATAAHTPGLVISFTASAVKCRSSNVDISAHSCELTFGSVNKTLSGRSAHELYATLVENGVPGDGAAGSIYEAVDNLHCTITADAVADRAGGGAQCSFDVP
ncbi:MAG: hypothetical protein P4L57_12010 [Rhizomicrobium sp.]|nr:hypothetical protein [Rhizomicrobium sp.]